MKPLSTTTPWGECPNRLKSDFLSPLHFAALLLCGVLAASPARAEDAAQPWRFNGVDYPRERALSAAELGLVPDADKDQTATLNQALVAVEKNPDADTLHLPAGVYYLAGQLHLRPGVNLIGDGPGVTRIERRDSSNYLLCNIHFDGQGAIVANITLNNDVRIVMLRDCRNLGFHHTEFRGGIVRFEDSASIALTGNTFNENRGKAGYASSKCDRITLTSNRFNGIENGSINLSGHTHCYVANNHITAAAPIHSGYAGIRLPNGAQDNLVENNFIENHGRGLFVLSGSSGNTLRGNIVKNATTQAVFVQCHDNIIQGNIIIDAGDEAIYLADGSHAERNLQSPADGNQVVGNVIYDTQAPADTTRHVALKIYGSNNIIRGNSINTQYGRNPADIAPNRGNQASDNTRWQ